MKGFRFQKRIRIAPGVQINLSKSGISGSIGGPGGSVNIGKDGIQGTVGAPGTGLSVSQNLSKAGKREAVQSEEGARRNVLLAAALACLVLAGIVVWLMVL